MDILKRDVLEYGIAIQHLAEASTLVVLKIGKVQQGTHQIVHRPSKARNSEKKHF